MGKVKQLLCSICWEEKDPSQDFCSPACERKYDGLMAMAELALSVMARKAAPRYDNEEAPF